jgi:ribonuclease HI
VLDGLLSEDFREFGTSGRIWTKTEVLTALAADTQTPIKSENFDCRFLGPDLALLTYVSSSSRGKALRCSVWHLEDETWRIVFHQGTPIGSG